MGTFDKVAPGVPLSDAPTSSAGWMNAVSEAAAAYHDGRTGGGASDTSLKSSSGLIKVRNLVEVESEKKDLLRGHYVQLGAYLLNPPNEADHPEIKHDFRKLWFEGNLYDSAKNNPIAILTRAARAEVVTEGEEEPAGEIMPARVIGVCTAIINVTDVDHRFAAPADGEYVLQSASSGPVEILEQPIGSTGEQELAVLIGGPVDTCKARVTTTVTAATGAATADWGSGEAILCDPSTGLPTGDPVAIDNEWPKEFVVDAQIEVKTNTTPPRVLGGTCAAEDAVTYWGDDP